MDTQSLLEHYCQRVQFPETNAFAALELLHLRSDLAAREEELDEAQEAQLEDADSALLRQAAVLYDYVSALGDLEELRLNAGVPEWHWWWHLERLV
jgi:hypothetical protein